VRSDESDDYDIASVLNVMVSNSVNCNVCVGE